MKIRQDGSITEALKGHKFRVKLADHPQHEVIATVCGKMHKSRIVLCRGDGVTVELSPYDLFKGRVMWRKKK